MPHNFKVQFVKRAFVSSYERDVGGSKHTLVQDHTIDIRVEG